MTTNMIEFDTDIIEALDFEFDTPCMSNIPVDCDKVAEWKLVLSCCGKPYLLCDKHSDKMQMTFIITDNMMHIADIGGCGSEHVKIISVERLDT